MIPDKIDNYDSATVDSVALKSIEQERELHSRDSFVSVATGNCSVSVATENFSVATENAASIGVKEHQHQDESARDYNAVKPTYNELSFGTHLNELSPVVEQEGCNSSFYSGALMALTMDARVKKRQLESELENIDNDIKKIEFESIVAECSASRHSSEELSVNTSKANKSQLKVPKQEEGFVSFVFSTIHLGVRQFAKDVNSLATCDTFQPVDSVNYLSRA